MGKRATDRQRVLAASDSRPVPAHQPSERFWPYAELPEEPTPEELAALDPDLREALFGSPPLPFSITLLFPPFEGRDYARALKLARASAEYHETGIGAAFRHRARFETSDAAKLRELWDIVSRLPTTEVLVDGRTIPFARELWLPLMWFLIP